MTPPYSPSRITIAGLLALAVAMGVGRFAFTPLLPMMQDDRLLTVAEGGLLASVHFFGYWLGALCATKITVAPRQVMRGSLLVIGVTTIAMGLTESFTLWVIFRWLSGACSAFILVLVSNYTLRHLSEAGHGEMQGWVFSGVGAGITLVGLGVLALMTYGIGSMPSWQIVGGVSFAIAVAAGLLMGSMIGDVHATSSDRIVPRSPLAWSAVIAYGVAGLGYIIPATYLPVMAREAVQSPLIYGWSWPIFGVAAFLSTLLSARLHAYFSNRQIWTVGQLIMAAGLLLPAVYPHIATIIVAGLCVGGTFLIITMAGMKEAHRVASTHDVQRHIAVLTAAFATGQMVGPAIAGWVYDAAESFELVLLITSAALTVTALILAWGAERKELVGT